MNQYKNSIGYKRNRLILRVESQYALDEEDLLDEFNYEIDNNQHIGFDHAVEDYYGWVYNDLANNYEDLIDSISVASSDEIECLYAKVFGN